MAAAAGSLNCAQLITQLQPIPAITLFAVFAVVVAGGVGEGEAEVFEEVEIAEGGFGGDAGFTGEFAESGTLAAGAQGAEERPLAEEWRLVGHGDEGVAANSVMWIVMDTEQASMALRHLLSDVPLVQRGGDS